MNVTCDNVFRTPGKASLGLICGGGGEGKEGRRKR